MAFKSAALLPGRGSLLVQSMRAPLSWLQGDNPAGLHPAHFWRVRQSEIPKGWGAGNQHPSLPQLVIAWAPSQHLPSLQQPGGLACGPSTFTALALILPPAYFFNSCFLPWDILLGQSFFQVSGLRDPISLPEGHAHALHACPISINSVSTPDACPDELRQRLPGNLSAVATKNQSFSDDIF